jgi:2'-5' RNA ligase
VRLFVAVVPPAEALARLAEVVAPLRDGGMRWAEPSGWHVTLAFLGEVTEGQLPQLAARFGRAAARHEPLRLALAGAGRFGDRALWAGLRGDTLALARLAQSVQAGARRAGIAVDEGPRFRAHLTLARTRPRARTDLRGYVDALAGFEGEPWLAAEIVLMSSRLGDGPAEYRAVESWPLGRG